MDCKVPTPTPWRNDSTTEATRDTTNRPGVRENGRTHFPISETLSAAILASDDSNEGVQCWTE